MSGRLLRPGAVLTALLLTATGLSAVWTARPAALATPG